jgi:N-acetyl-anhydromuramyl-L-alanine amidase AmpD
MRAWLADDERQTSTHFVILRDGRILQAAELTERTWHSGGSTWVDPAGRARRGVNAMSIGIDLENVGILRRAPGGGGFIDGYGGAYKGAAPLKIGDVWCEPYTPAQAEQVVALAAQLAAQVRALRDGRRWVGHCDIQIGKADPGPAMPWAALRAAVEAVP